MEDVINLDLQLTNDFNADFLVGEDSTALGVANTPFNAGGGFRATMGYNLDAVQHTTNPEVGGGHDRFLTIIHEFGHSIGLGHPHDDGANTTLGPGATSFGDTMAAPYQWHHMMMGYSSAPNIGFNEFGFGRPVTPMALDIAVLQNMYGANMSTRTGDSTYTLTDAGTTALDLTGETISVGQAYYGI